MSYAATVAALGGTQTVILNYDTVVPQSDISQGGGSVLMSGSFTVPVATKILACTTFRWLAVDPLTTTGPRVAFIRIDNQDVGSLMITTSAPSDLWQLSNGGCITTSVSGGVLHNFAVHFGGCCGVYGHPFTVGAGSRISIVW
jgi:hypothetical protein